MIIKRVSDMASASLLLLAAIVWFTGIGTDTVNLAQCEPVSAAAGQITGLANN